MNEFDTLPDPLDPLNLNGLYGGLPIKPLDGPDPLSLSDPMNSFSQINPNNQGLGTSGLPPATPMESYFGYPPAQSFPNPVEPEQPIFDIHEQVMVPNNAGDMLPIDPNAHEGRYTKDPYEEERKRQEWLKKKKGIGVDHNIEVDYHEIKGNSHQNHDNDHDMNAKDYEQPHANPCNDSQHSNIQKPRGRGGQKRYKSSKLKKQKIRKVRSPKAKDGNQNICKNCGGFAFDKYCIRCKWELCDTYGLCIQCMEELENGHCNNEECPMHIPDNCQECGEREDNCTCFS